MVRLRDRFCQKCCGTVGEGDLVTSDLEFGIAMFASLSWAECDWWPDANMKSVFCYLRGATTLNLGGLRPLFPQEI